MVIFDGKVDLEFFHSLLPYIHRAGRMGDLRLLNPSRPELSVQYNPFATEDDNYMAQVSMNFGAFDLHDEFFAKHQLNYLARRNAWIRGATGTAVFTPNATDGDWAVKGW
jgi:hypothetical protein